LSILLNPKLSLDHILLILKDFGFHGGTTLTIMASITQKREENEYARKKGIEMANKVISQEKDAAIQNIKQANPIGKEIKQKSVFISYCWANKQTIRRLNDLMQEKGIDCWLDDSIMQGGSQLFGEIDDGISNCKVFVACCSNNYGASVNCQRELLLATDRKKLIIPTLVGTCDPWPPKGQMGPLLAGKIYIDISSDEKFEKTVIQLLTAVKQSL